MNGLLIYHTIQTVHEQKRLQHLIDAFARYKMKVVTVQLDQVIRLLETTTPGFFSFAYLFAEDLQLAKALEKGYNLHVYNQETAINIANDRALLSLTLRNEGISHPQTIVLPYVMNQSIMHQWSDVKTMIQPLAFPFLIKERYVSPNQPVYFIRSDDDLVATFQQVGLKPLLAQEYIGPLSRRVIKVLVVFQNATTSYEVMSTSQEDVYKNAPFSSRSSVYKVAVQTAEALGASIALVHMLVINNRIPYVYGVKTNPDLEEIEVVTGTRVVEGVVKAIQRDLSRHR
jgi:glutathione synthase/RimK-type ligase-like ATP-grasp enzyme